MYFCVHMLDMHTQPHGSYTHSVCTLLLASFSVLALAICSMYTITRVRLYVGLLVCMYVMCENIEVQTLSTVLQTKNQHADINVPSHHIKPYHIVTCILLTYVITSQRRIYENLPRKVRVAVYVTVFYVASNSPLATNLI